VQRPALLLAAALVAATVAGCGGSSTPDNAGEPTGLPTPTVQESATAVASAVTSDTAQQTISLTVAGGKVSGDTGRVKVALGTRLRITVTADVADEIHVHVYDLHQDISVNQPGSIEFVADKPGIVDVELEKSKLTLTRLQIS
jgi:hypothetical protein